MNDLISRQAALDAVHGDVARAALEALPAANSQVKKQSSPELSSLAGRILAGYSATADEVRSLAASVLSQDETA